MLYCVQKPEHGMGGESRFLPANFFTHSVQKSKLVERRLRYGYEIRLFQAARENGRVRYHAGTARGEDWNQQMHVEREDKRAVRFWQ